MSQLDAHQAICLPTPDFESCVICFDPLVAGENYPEDDFVGLCTNCVAEGQAVVRYEDYLLELAAR